MTYSSLIEPGTIYYTKCILKKCREHKHSFYNAWMNIVLFVLFLVIVTLILWYSYNEKDLTDKRKENEDHVLSTLRYLKKKNDDINIEQPYNNDYPYDNFYM